MSLAVAKNPKLANSLTAKHNMVAVVSDGSSVLGLGNIGPLGALPVMEGKAILFKEFADIDAVPIVLNSQDPDEIVKAVEYIAPTFGGINLEDIAAPKCFYIEEQLRSKLNIPVMHDDQHGTAMVVLAALSNALKVVEKSMEEVKIVVNGAGSAGTAIVKLLKLAGAKNLLLVDTTGIIYNSRPHLSTEKKELARITNPKKIKGDLAVALQDADVFIGVSRGGLVSESMVTRMNKKAIIFALANPIPEIMPDEAKRGGAMVVATGRSDFANQINNVLIFPGFFRGLLDSNQTAIKSNMYLNAAKALAGLIKKPKKDLIIPQVFDKRVVKVVSRAVSERFV